MNGGRKDQAKRTLARTVSMIAKAAAEMLIFLRAVG